MDELRIIDRPELPPGHCIATMRSEDPRGFIDTLLTPAVIDPRVYLSVSYIEELARALGMEYPEGKSEDVDDLKRQLEDAEKALAAIDVMESAGFVARKKRTPAKKTSAKKVKA